MNLKTVFLGKDKTAFLFLLLSIIYLLSRSYHLLSLPIFSDEAIYIRWAQTIIDHPRSLFISLVDGKQPLFIWAIVFFLKIIHDPLLAGRIAGIFFGLLTLFGLFVFARIFFHEAKLGLISMFIYILSPMALVYDRMALYESATGASTIWSMVLFLYFLKKPTVLQSIVVGLSWGTGLLIKSSGFFIIFLSFPLAFFLLPKYKASKHLLFRYGILLLLSFCVATMLYSVLRVSQYYSQLEAKNAVFIYHFSELIPYGAFYSWPKNLWRLGNWVFVYQTGILGLLSLFSLIFVREYKKQIMTSWFLFLTAVFTTGLFGRILNPRYIFSPSLFLIPLAAVTLSKLLLLAGKSLALKIATLCLVTSVIIVDYGIVHDFSSSSIPKEDLVQYINGWPAGGGMSEIMTYLAERSKGKEIFVYTEGIYGSLPTTVSEIYFGNNRNIHLKSFDPEEKDALKPAIKSEKEAEAYVVLNQLQKPNASWNVKKIAEYRKGNSNFLSSLYLLNP